MAKRGGGGGARRGAKKAAGIPALELRSRLEQGERASCYLIVGAEPFLRGAALEALRTTLLGANPGPSLWELDGPKAQLAEVLDELRTLPFLGTSHRLVVVDDAAPFVAAHGEALERFLASPMEHATLALSAAKLDKRLKATKAVEAVATIVDCAPFDEAGLRRFLRERARVAGRPFGRGAAETLLARLGGQDVPLHVIDAEVSKLAAAGEGEITPRDVEALASFGSSEQGFALIDRMSAGDVEGALETVGRFFRDGLITAGGTRTREPTGIAMILLPTLRWDLNRLLRARALLDRGATPADVLESLRVWKDKQRFLQRVRAASAAELARRHAALRAADVALRTSADPAGTLTDVVLRLTLAERGPARAGR